MKTLQRRRRGQGMTEYIIIVGLIAIVMVGAVVNFKNALENAFKKGTEKIESDIVDGMDGDKGDDSAESLLENGDTP